jgi:hypothetical protein
MTKINVLKVLLRAQACCARVPDRNIAERTRQAYGKTFGRMLQEGNLDPLRPNIACDTYNHRRAALLTGGRLFLEERIAECVAAGERRDEVAVQQQTRELLCVVEKIEKAFDREPPLAVGASPFKLPPSRFRQAESADRERGLNSKKHDLEHLPEGWDVDLWDTATGRAYKDWPHLEALAVHLLTGVRPEELVPGMRPAGWSAGVQVELRSEKCLAITFMPAKSHRGLFGTRLTTICIDPAIAAPPAAFLAERCRLSANHRIVVSIASKEAVRKAIIRLGEDALSGSPPARKISFRNGYRTNGPLGLRSIRGNADVGGLYRLRRTLRSRRGERWRIQGNAPTFCRAALGDAEEVRHCDRKEMADCA